MKRHDAIVVLKAELMDLEIVQVNKFVCTLKWKGYVQYVNKASVEEACKKIYIYTFFLLVLKQS